MHGNVPADAGGAALMDDMSGIVSMQPDACASQQPHRQ